MSSKQPARRGNGANRGATAPKPGVGQPTQSASDKAFTTPPKRTGASQTGAQARQARAVPKKRGFRLRPLDIGLIVVGIAVVGFIVWSGLSNANSNANPGETAARPPNPRNGLLPVGRQAPDFSLPAPDGKTYSLSQFKGKVVLLEIMAPWCPHCQNDAAILNKVYDNYKDKNVQMLAVSGSPYGRNYEDSQGEDKTPISMDDMTWFKDKFGVQYPVLLDKDLKVADAYGLRYFPTIYLIDKNGNIASQVAGLYQLDANGNELDRQSDALTYEKIAAELDKVLAVAQQPAVAGSR